MIRRLLFSAVLTVLSVTAASSTTISKPGEIASFSLLGTFSYTPPVGAGSTILIDYFDSLIVAPTGEFAGLVPGTVSVSGVFPIPIAIEAGALNNGEAFIVEYDRVTIPADMLVKGPGSETGTLSFDVVETVSAAIDTVGNLRAIEVIFAGTLIDLGGFYDPVPVNFIFAATTQPGSGGGTWSLTVDLETPQVPLPASFPMLLVGLGGLGIYGYRRRSA